MKKLIALFTLLFFSQLFGQDIFEQALSGESESASATTYELNGYVRGVLYGGETLAKDGSEIKSNYGEASLKLRIRKQEFGDAFAEWRFRRGNEFGTYVSELSLREAYVNAYLGNFDFRIGHQIVVWGRADGFNPTNNITPYNMLVRSPNEDDRREGNFLIRSHYTFHAVRLEAIWVPTYAPSVLPTSIIPLPAGITLGQPEYPDADLANSSLAIKLNLELAAFDGSISYFYGYNPLPGITMGQLFSVVPKAYKMRITGADFSTTFGSFGLRGEFAHRSPENDYKTNIFIPNPDLQYVLGADKDMGNFSFIVQYIGRYVLDFAELHPPQNPLEMMSYELEQKNRMLTGQLNELSHASSFRIGWKSAYETLKIELAGLYNFTTEESLIRPSVKYDITDALTFSVGGEIFSGPDDTLFGFIDSALSALFLELKASF